MGEKKVKNSTKLFFSGVFVLTISNLIIKAIGLLFKIPMHNLFGGDGMGYYNTAYQIYTAFYMISTAGLPVATSIMISESRSLGKIDQVKKIFKISLGLFFVVGFVGMALMIFGANFFSVYVIKNEPAALCIMAIAPTLFFVCLSSAMRGYFQGYQHMLPVAVSQLIEALCKLFLGIAFAMYALNKYGSDPGGLKYVAAYAILGLTIGAGLGMVYLTFTKMLFKSDKYDAEYLESSGEDHEVTKSSQILKRLAIIAIPITISSSVLSITNLIDSVLIQNLLQTFRGMTPLEVTSVFGNYTTLAVPMFNLPPVLIYPISYSIVPLITAARTLGDNERAQRITESAMRVAILIGIPCAIGLASLSDPILSLFFRDRAAISSTAHLLSLLAPSTFFLCVLSVTNAILQAYGHERKPLISMAIGAGAKIAFDFLLLILIGIEGTPISTFICYLTATVINIFFITKHTDLKIRLTRVFLRPLFAGIVCGAAAVGSRYLFAIFLPGKVATVLAILSAIGVYATLIFVIKAIAPDDVELLPKKEKIKKIISKLKLNSVASTLAVCIFIGVIGGAGILITGSRYKKSISSASLSQSEAVSLYSAAAKARPLKADGYFGLARAIGSDGVFDESEEAILNKRLNTSIADLSKKDFYGDLAYEILKLYLNCYESTEEGKTDLSEDYVTRVDRWAGNTVRYSEVPAVYRDFASSLSVVTAYLLDNMTKSDAEEYTEEENVADGFSIADQFERLAAAVVKCDDPGAAVRAARIAAQTIRTCREELKKDGMTEEGAASAARALYVAVQSVDVPDSANELKETVLGELDALAGENRK